jgi:hypothetical protein
VKAISKLLPTSNLQPRKRRSGQNLEFVK